MVSGFALSPTRLRTGSPGSAFIRAKVINVILNKRGINRKSLFKRYVLM
jgi:hypothetical protein